MQSNGTTSKNLNKKKLSKRKKQQLTHLNNKINQTLFFCGSIDRKMSG